MLPHKFVIKILLIYELLQFSEHFCTFIYVSKLLYLVDLCLNLSLHVNAYVCIDSVNNQLEFLAYSRHN